MAAAAEAASSQALGKTYSQAENPETLAGQLPEPRPRDCAAFLASCALQHEAEARLVGPLPLPRARAYAMQR